MALANYVWYLIVGNIVKANVLLSVSDHYCQLDRNPPVAMNSQFREILLNIVQNLPHLSFFDKIMINIANLPYLYEVTKLHKYNCSYAQSF